MDTPWNNENEEFLSTREKLNSVEWNDEIWIERYLANAKQRYQKTMEKIKIETTKLVNMALDVSDAIPETTYIASQREKAKEILELLKKMYNIELLKIFAMPIDPLLYECIWDEWDEERRIKEVCKHFWYKYFWDLCKTHPRSFCCRIDEYYTEIKFERWYENKSNEIEALVLKRLIIWLHEYEVGMWIAIPEWENFRPIE